MPPKRKLPMVAPRQPTPSHVTRRKTVVESNSPLDDVMQVNEGGVQLASTVWEDMQNSLIGRRLASQAGKVDYNYDEIGIDFSSGGNINNISDCVAWPLQMYHCKKLGTSIHIHIHFEQTDDVEREFTLAYRVQHQLAEKEESWTTVKLNTVTDAHPLPDTYTTFNNLASFPAIPVADTTVSDIVQFKMTRSDSESGIVLVTFADGHYEKDSFGSAGEYTKWTE